jgi:hypothetical protein
MKVVRKDVKGFYGMNPQAAKHFHIKMPSNEIWIPKHLPKNLPLKEVKNHELIEYKRMKYLHESYVKADRFAERHEKDCNCLKCNRWRKK